VKRRFLRDGDLTFVEGRQWVTIFVDDKDALPVRPADAPFLSRLGRETGASHETRFRRSIGFKHRRLENPLKTAGNLLIEMAGARAQHAKAPLCGIDLMRVGRGFALDRMKDRVTARNHRRLKRGKGAEQ